MPPLLRNLLALVLGLVIGGSVNMALVQLGHALIPGPSGVDLNTPEGWARAMPLLKAQHFLFPFLAHALGVLAGALAAWFIAASHKARFAWAIGAVFLLGGIAAAFMIPAPGWFVVLDLLLAYLPMAWLAIRLGTRFSPEAA